MTEQELNVVKLTTIKTVIEALEEATKRLPVEEPATVAPQKVEGLPIDIDQIENRFVFNSIGSTLEISYLFSWLVGPVRKAKWVHTIVCTPGTVNDTRKKNTEVWCITLEDTFGSFLAQIKGGLRTHGHRIPVFSADAERQLKRVYEEWVGALK